MRLLVAEDDPKLLKTLKHILENGKYLVDGVTDGQEALLYAETEEYDGLVLDIMMPGMDGVEVLKRLRGQGISTPALFLTARTEIYQRVDGLDAGADDYLPKPFATAELLARVRAMLRRKDHFTPDLLVCRRTNPQPLHLRAGIPGHQPISQRTGISDCGNAVAAARLCGDHRRVSLSCVGLEQRGGCQRGMGTHLQHP